jgi:DhnA family fructose-bisphosphate aldolase class Ia
MVPTRRTREVTHRKIVIAIDHGVCVLCGNPAIGFREVENSIEYLRSGLCQTCQDSTSSPEDRR